MTDPITKLTRQRNAIAKKRDKVGATIIHTIDGYAQWNELNEQVNEINLKIYELTK